MTFTPQNWSDPQAIAVTSQAGSVHSRRQVILVFKSSLPGGYGGIHVTVGGASSSSGVSGASTDSGLSVLELDEEPEPQQQHQEPHNGEPASDGNVGVAEPAGDNTGSAGGVPVPHSGGVQPTTHQTSPEDADTGGSSGGGDADADNSGDGDSDTERDESGDAADDEVPLDQVRAALEQYDNGEITYDELLDLIRRYLAN